MEMGGKSTRHIWNMMKMSSIYAIEIPERERENGVEEIYEKLLTKNLSNLIVKC